MKLTLTKLVAAGGLCVLFASAAGAASAQDYYHGGPKHAIVHKAHHKIAHLQAKYARDVAKGDREAAARDHAKAMATRHKVRRIVKHDQ